MKILQVGLGGFGKNHLRAWAQLGRAGDLTVADLSPARLQEAADLIGLPPERLGTDYRRFLAEADVVDVVTPSVGHAAICTEALRAGKDVFVEKPMTMTAEEADRVAVEVERSGRRLQVGYYYRFHPIARYVRERIALGELGAIRYLDGRFMGFKRARTDCGVTQTDGIHFIDLFNAVLGETPVEAYAVTRDHFRRGLEDLSIVLLQYPGGAVAKVECGYIQPGDWTDRVVPGAMTTKEITVVGERRTIRADFEIDRVELFEVRHELRHGVWTPVQGACTLPRLASVTPVDLVALELDAFLDSVRAGRTPEADVVASGTALARVIEAIYRSAATGRPSPVEPVAVAA